ncbi:PIN domain-containing protein [Candidatus Accumulibacter meliphilus]|jgi:hypothetical protein|uniref:PIN domain-containing protein n=1 Tax=Candidatus Accumulibacter meliphilus TaxID=2211374 RepID=UPI003DA8D7A4
MNKKLILVDYENISRIDLSILDDSFRAIIFVGAKQNRPKASTKKTTEHRFARVDFQKIDGSGKNALDFHIAFELGRTIEIAPTTKCFVLSKDKGFDPLLSHLNKNGLQCRRVTCITELVPQGSTQARVSETVTCSTEHVPDQDAHTPTPDAVLCGRCRKESTIEHNGGRWCSNCGCFSQPPDPTCPPPKKIGYVMRSRR